MYVYQINHYLILSLGHGIGLNQMHLTEFPVLTCLQMPQWADILVEILSSHIVRQEFCMV